MLLDYDCSTQVIRIALSRWRPEKEVQLEIARYCRRPHIILSGQQPQATVDLEDVAFLDQQQRRQVEHLFSWNLRIPRCDVAWWERRHPRILCRCYPSPTQALG